MITERLKHICFRNCRPVKATSFTRSDLSSLLILDGNGKTPKTSSVVSCGIYKLVQWKVVDGRKVDVVW